MEMNDIDSRKHDQPLQQQHNLHRQNPLLHQNQDHHDNDTDAHLHEKFYNHFKEEIEIRVNEIERLNEENSQLARRLQDTERRLEEAEAKLQETFEERLQTLSFERPSTSAPILDEIKTSVTRKATFELAKKNKRNKRKMDKLYKASTGAGPREHEELLDRDETGSLDSPLELSPMKSAERAYAGEIKKSVTHKATFELAKKNERNKQKMNKLVNLE